MPRLHIAVQIERFPVRPNRTNFSDPFGRLPILHLTVVQTGSDQKRRVVDGLNPIVGRIRQHAEVRLFFVGIAPLFVFPGGQGNGRVQHGGHHVHKRNGGHNSPEQIRAQIEHRAHQQTSSTAAHGVEAGSVGPAGPYQMFRARNEIREGIELVLHFAPVVPEAAHFLAAPNVRNGVAVAALQPAQTRGRERWIQRVAVGAVSVDQKRNGTRCVCGHHQRNGNAGTVCGRGPDAVRAELFSVVSAHHLLHLAQASLAGGHAVVKHLTGLHQRGVAHPKPFRVVVRIGPQVSGIGRVFKSNFVLGLGSVPRFHHHTGQAVDALLQNQEMRKQLHAFEQNVRTMRQHLAPMTSIGLVLRALHEFEILRAVGIGSEVPAVLKMGGTVLQLRGTRLKTPPGTGGLVRAQHVHFVGRAAAGGNDQELLALGSVHRAGERFVLLVKQFYGFGTRGAQLQPHNAIHPQRLLVFGGKEHVRAARRPRSRPGRAGGHQNGRSIGSQHRTVQIVATSAHEIHAVDHLPVVRCEKQTAHLAIRMPFGQLIDVQEQFFLPNRFAANIRLSAMKRIFLSFLVARVVPKSFAQNRHAFVHLGNASHHFLVERFLQRTNRLHFGTTVLVFGLQVGNDFRVVPVVQPEIRIYSLVAVDFHPVVPTRGNGFYSHHMRDFSCKIRINPSFEGVCAGLYSTALR